MVKDQIEQSEWFPLVHRQATGICIHISYSFMLVDVGNSIYTLLPYKASIQQLELFFTKFPKRIRGTMQEMKKEFENISQIS